jgi:hypothetical protein
MCQERHGTFTANGTWTLGYVASHLADAKWSHTAQTREPAFHLFQVNVLVSKLKSIRRAFNVSVPR